jgi:hypothetical protein
MNLYKLIYNKKKMNNMKTIKKWDTFRNTIMESNDEEAQAQEAQALAQEESEEMIIKTDDDIKTEEDLKDFFNIKK